MVAHIYNSKTCEVEAGSSGIEGHPCLLSKFEVSLGYTRPCLKKNLILSEMPRDGFIW